MSTFLSDYDYALPDELIASFPTKERCESGLLCVERKTGQLSHRIFRELPSLLKKGDVLVLNDTKVIPARLIGKRESGGETEALLVKAMDHKKWECLLRPGGKIKKGAQLSFSSPKQTLSLTVLDDPREGTGLRLVEFDQDDYDLRIETIGHIPLPPYIQREDNEQDRTRYQTVFAEKKGAIAAPTAGLHFTEELLAQIQALGVEIVYVTLHVSYGTFQPIQVDDISEYKIFEEEIEISRDAAAKVNAAKKENRRVIACGTTSVRALESAAMDNGELVARKSMTDLFIYPPYDFKIVDGMITNFHLPKSSLLMLVSALLGKERTLAAYREAVEKKYRFYSYGDAMVIL